MLPPLIVELAGRGGSEQLTADKDKHNGQVYLKWTRFQATIEGLHENRAKK